ncbi:MAG: tRNA (adenosine(37)-N6)-threonylcarbamoyltransferase complex dimerization subunit type 1 TsaB [Gammaproteobacteria bacterium]|nr:tRNA (adenosine(37)-N6)-threonylcarbamoyltransferase complex dimerization subunit type 1 TsaB [Gammaproteobacteria bacterium]
MKILALDTSTEACSAALLIDSHVSQRYEVAPREHGALILPMIEQLLNEAGIDVSQLDALAFGRGPGAFVGVRIASGVAQGIAFAADLPVVPVSSLAALAQGVEYANVYAAIDARMDEVYWAAYHKASTGVVELVGDETVCPPHAVIAAPGDSRSPWYGVGSGWGVYADELHKQVGVVCDYDAHRYPQAKHIARIAETQFIQGGAVQADQAMPTYLRNNVAKKAAKKAAKKSSS